MQIKKAPDKSTQQLKHQEELDDDKTDPDIIPDENPFETPGYLPTDPGEAP